MLRVRPARPEDDAVIGELLVQSYLAAYARKMPEVVLTARRLADLRDVGTRRAIATLLAGELEGRVVGTVALFPPGAAGSEAWLPNAADLRHLATHPSVHGQVLSTTLFNHGIAALFRDGRRRIYRTEPTGGEVGEGGALRPAIFELPASSNARGCLQPHCRLP